MAHFESRGYGCSCPDETCDMNCGMYRIVAGKPSNADRIRAMTDEELAELLTDVAKKSADKLCESLKIVEADLSNCNFHILYKAHLDWLKQEVKE